MEKFINSYEKFLKNYKKEDTVILSENFDDEMEFALIANFENELTVTAAAPTPKEVREMLNKMKRDFYKH